MDDRTDVTERATAAGWTLPSGWTVWAWATHDDVITDPREEGDVYNTDVDEKDYSHPTRAFCRHCGAWIRELDDDSLTGTGPDADGREPESGDWADLATGIDCPEGNDRAHEPDLPLVVRWWREDRWEFVDVDVVVEDPDGREWGAAGLGGTESGWFPTDINADTGEVTSTNIDPINDGHPVPELISQALTEAVESLAAHGEAAPVILAPDGQTSGA